jgi:hypothetical protein
MAMACPGDWPGQPAMWAMGPIGQLPGSTWTGCEKFMCAYFISENYKKLYNLVKCISIDLVVRKICMLYQDVKKNMLYILVSNSCIVKKLETLSK